MNLIKPCAKGIESPMGIIPKNIEAPEFSLLRSAKWKEWLRWYKVDILLTRNIFSGSSATISEISNDIIYRSSTGDVIFTYDNGTPDTNINNSPFYSYC